MLPLLKNLVLIALGVAVGWFVRATLDGIIHHDLDWRNPGWHNPACWALAGAIEIIVLLCLF